MEAFYKFLNRLGPHLKANARWGFILVILALLVMYMDYTFPTNEYQYQQKKYTEIRAGVHERMQRALALAETKLQEIDQRFTAKIATQSDRDSFMREECLGLCLELGNIIYLSARGRFVDEFPASIHQRFEKLHKESVELRYKMTYLATVNERRKAGLEMLTGNHIDQYMMDRRKFTWALPFNLEQDLDRGGKTANVVISWLWNEVYLGFIPLAAIIMVLNILFFGYQRNQSVVKILLFRLPPATLLWPFKIWAFPLTFEEIVRRVEVKRIQLIHGDKVAELKQLAVSAISWGDFYDKGHQLGFRISATPAACIFFCLVALFRPVQAQTIPQKQVIEQKLPDASSDQEKPEAQADTSSAPAKTEKVSFANFLFGKQQTLTVYSPDWLERPVKFLQEEVTKLEVYFFAQQLRTTTYDELGVRTTRWQDTGSRFKKMRLEITCSREIGDLVLRGKYVQDLEGEPHPVQELWAQVEFCQELKLLFGHHFSPVGYPAPAPTTIATINSPPAHDLLTFYRIGGYLSGTVDWLTYYLGAQWDSTPEQNFQWHISSNDGYETYLRLEASPFENFFSSLQGAIGQLSKDDDRKTRWRLGAELKYFFSWTKDSNYFGDFTIRCLYLALHTPGMMQHGGELTVWQDFIGGHFQLVGAYNTFRQTGGVLEQRGILGCNFYPFRNQCFLLAGKSLSFDHVRFSVNIDWNLRHPNQRKWSFLLQYAISF